MNLPDFSGTRGYGNGTTGGIVLELVDYTASHFGGL